jgi:hypothetical protein
MSASCLSGIFAQSDRDTQRQWWAEKRDPVGVPLPTRGREVCPSTSYQVYEHAPQVFFKSQAPKRGRVLQDRFQQGATPLGFSTYNSRYVLTKNQEVFRDLLSEALGIFSRGPQ